MPLSGDRADAPVSFISRCSTISRRTAAPGSYDLVLMDVQTLHRHSGLAAGKRIKESCPNTKVVIMTSLVDPEVLSKAKTGCADGLCYKDHGDDEVMTVIERVLNGERSFPDETPPVELEDILSSEIKPIQLEILRLYIRGMSFAEIGQKLGITGDAARWHIRDMVSRCGFDSKEELMAACETMARKLSLIHI